MGMVFYNYNTQPFYYLLLIAILFRNTNLWISKLKKGGGFFE